MIQWRAKTPDADILRYPGLIVGAAALAVVIPCSASAQVTGPLTGPSAQTLPVSSQTGLADQFSITPAIDVLYDSNVLRLNDLRSAAGPRDDVRVTPAVAFDIRQQVARNSVSVTGAVGYDFYRRLNGLERLRANMSAGAKVPFGGRCEISPSGNIQIQQADIEDLDVPAGRTLRILTGQVSAQCKRSSGFYPVAGGNILRLTNSGGRGLNRTNRNATAGLVYARPSLGQVQMFVNAGRFRRSNILGTDTGADVVAIGVQFDRAITSRFATRLLVSAVRTNPSRVDGVGFEGLNYIADFRIAPIPSLILSPTVSRQFSGTINTGADYVLVREAAIGLDWSLGQRTGFTAQLGRNRRRYFGEDPLIRPELRIVDSTDSIRAGFRYTVRTLRLGLGIAYRERDGLNDFYDFSSTRVEFSARAGF